MPAPNGSCLVVVALTFACSSGISEVTPKSDAHVTESEGAGFCDAFAVMQEKCVRCHGSPPAHGAPFALDSYDATQVPSHDGKTIRADRMREVIDSGFMPLTSLRLDPPVESLSCEEKATILEWIDAGALPPPDADPDCAAARPSLTACDP